MGSTDYPGAHQFGPTQFEHAVIVVVATRNCGKSVRRAWLVQVGAWLGLAVVLAAYWQDITTARGHKAFDAAPGRLASENVQRAYGLATSDTFASARSSQASKIQAHGLDNECPQSGLRQLLPFKEIDSTDTATV
jgi:hypothetical protein